MQIIAAAQADRDPRPLEMFDGVDTIWSIRTLMDSGHTTERREQEAVRVGVVAAAGRLATLAAAVYQTPDLTLCAQCGPRQADALADVPWFDDVRIMLRQAGIELLIVGGATRLATEIAHAALDAGVHVWRQPPLGRNFAEAIAEARLAVRGRPLYRAASYWEAIAETVSVAWGDLATFRSGLTETLLACEGPVAAAPATSRPEYGGVLLNDGYALLEALVALRGLPETVTATVGVLRRRADGSLRDGEDTAAAILRFEGGIATVRVAWDLPIRERVIAHHAADQTLRIVDGRLERIDASGALQSAGSLSENLLAADLRRTLEQVRTGRPDAGTIERHLAVMALIDTVHLSAQTQQPETPRKLYEVQGWPYPLL